MNALCDCAACVSRRNARNKWFAKNKARVLKKNRDWRRAKRTEVRQSMAAVSDAELDRRALAMEAR